MGVRCWRGSFAGLLFRYGVAVVNFDFVGGSSAVVSMLVLFVCFCGIARFGCGVKYFLYGVRMCSGMAIFL